MGSCLSVSNFTEPKGGQTLNGTTTQSKGKGKYGAVQPTPEESRETRAAQAELRAAAASNRGIKNNGGKLNNQLKSQKADGGRKEDGILAGTADKSVPLVYD